MRSFLYKLAWLLGDAKAASRGPGAIGKRVERRLVGRVPGKLMGKLFR